VGSTEPRSGGVGLERSCGVRDTDRVVSVRPTAGVELFSAWFSGRAYEPHRHDTYAVGVTDCGVQLFDYRGASRTSTRGQVVALYPDERHDGRAGSAAGFGYRIVYVEPARLSAALSEVCGRACSLPFLPDGVVTSPRLRETVSAAFRTPLEPLAADSLVVELAEGLLAAERGGAPRTHPGSIDRPAIERAREFLAAERTRVVHSRQLEAITGLTRYALARQFKAIFGTSPYRYLLMRRLDLARELIEHGRRLVDVAGEVGFADQSHLTRAFKSGLGLSPARYRALRIGTRSR
jgi:AraC-like DNA-binding protein